MQHNTKIIQNNTEYDGIVRFNTNIQNNTREYRMLQNSAEEDKKVQHNTNIIQNNTK